jgi:hypothetical protein
MSVFRSQFDRARSYTEAYAGDARDSAWRSPTVIAALIGGGAAMAAAAVPVVAGDAKEAAGEQDPAGEEGPAGGKTAAGDESPGDQSTWGEGWEAGWDAPAGSAGGTLAADDGSGSWMDRGEYTDAGAGGDEDFFYFIDGDTSAVVE